VSRERWPVRLNPAGLQVMCNILTSCRVGACGQRAHEHEIKSALDRRSTVTTQHSHTTFAHSAHAHCALRAVAMARVTRVRAMTGGTFATEGSSQKREGEFTLHTCSGFSIACEGNAPYTPTSTTECHWRSCGHHTRQPRPLSATGGHVATIHANLDH
jgi:hypothetical protein